MHGILSRLWIVIMQRCMWLVSWWQGLCCQRDVAPGSGTQLFHLVMTLLITPRVYGSCRALAACKPCWLVGWLVSRALAACKPCHAHVCFVACGSCPTGMCMELGHCTQNAGPCAAHICKCHTIVKQFASHTTPASFAGEQPPRSPSLPLQPSLLLTHALNAAHVADGRQAAHQLSACAQLPHLTAGPLPSCCLAAPPAHLSGVSGHAPTKHRAPRTCM